MPEDLDMPIGLKKLIEDRTDTDGRVIIIGGPSNCIVKKVIEKLVSYDNKEDKISIISTGTFSNQLHDILDEAVNLIDIEAFQSIFYDIRKESINPAKRTKAQEVVRPMRVMSRNLNKHLYDRTKASHRGR